MTGIRFRVSANEGVMMLMLLDEHNGDALWFNFHQDDAHVGGERRLRSFVKKACSHLMKPKR